MNSMDACMAVWVREHSPTLFGVCLFLLEGASFLDIIIIFLGPEQRFFLSFLSFFSSLASHHLDVLLFVVCGWVCCVSTT